MEKFLVVLDSVDMNESTVNFACYLARLTDCALTAVFLDNPDTYEEIIFKQAGRGTFVESIAISPEEDENRIMKRHENMTLFKARVETEDTEAFVHLDRGVPLEEVISESRFADGLIINAGLTFSGASEKEPTPFVKNILHDAECPVIICHENPEYTDTIIFCYDGQKSSVFAMKQFTHLFPQLGTKRLKILHLNNDDSLNGRQEVRIVEWLRHHYKNGVEWIAAEGNSQKVLFDYLLHKQNSFVVMGTYGRGLLSSFFDENGRANKLCPPIFVSHL